VPISARIVCPSFASKYRCAPRDWREIAAARPVIFALERS
jgi:hypothetical protein